MGDMVGAVAFLSAPGIPEHSVLLTAVSTRSFQHRSFMTLPSVVSLVSADRNSLLTILLKEFASRERLFRHVFTVFHLGSFLNH